MSHNRSIQYAPGLICPYCLTSLKIKTQNNFGTADCHCNQYPVLLGIISIFESPDLINRQLVKLIQHKRFHAAIWQAMSGNRRHKLIVFVAFVLSFNFHFRIPLHWILRFLIFFGPSRDWFRYLLHRDRRSDIQLAASILKRHPLTTGSISDLGCGIGSFYSGLSSKIPQNSYYIGIDKSFLSLLIFRLTQPKVSLVSVDIETGLPLSAQSQTNVIVLDTFSLLKSKSQVLTQISTCLTAGYAFIGNLYPDTNLTHSWGYGISKSDFRRLAEKYFKRLELFNQDIPPGYTCLAFKK